MDIVATTRSERLQVSITCPSPLLISFTHIRLPKRDQTGRHCSCDDYCHFFRSVSEQCLDGPNQLNLPSSLFSLSSSALASVMIFLLLTARFSSSFPPCQIQYPNLFTITRAPIFTISIRNVQGFSVIRIKHPTASRPITKLLLRT